LAVLLKKIFVPVVTSNELFHWAAGNYDKDLFSSEWTEWLCAYGWTGPTVGILHLL